MSRRQLMRRMGRLYVPPAGGAFMEVGTDAMVANWNPNPFADLVYGSNGFLAAGAGIGDSESTAMPRDANGWPQASWQLLCVQAGNRPNPATLKTGVWKVRITDTAAGNAGVLTATLAGATLSNQVRAGQVVTADLTVTGGGSEAFIAFAYPHAISEFRVVDPDFPISTTRIMNDEARAFAARQYGFRVLNLSGQNSQTVPGSASWATEQPMQKAHGQKGWGFLCDMYAEIATAPGSRCKRFGLNAPPKWVHGPGNVADYTSWVTYIRSKTIGVPGSVITWATTNETWNGGTYQHFHWFMQQARNGFVNTNVGDLNPWLPQAADLARIQSGTSDHFVHWARWWGLRDARLANVVKAVYGADFGTRALFNCETHFFNPYWHRDIIFPWLSESAQTTEFGVLNTYFQTVSVAPYISIQGDMLAGITSAANALSVMRDGAGNAESMAGCLAQIDLWNGVATTHNLGGVVLYEFNSTHLDPYLDTAQGQFFVDAINSAGSKTLMRDFLDALNARGVKYGYALGCWPMTYPPLLGGQSKQNTMWGMTQNYTFNTPSSPSSRDGGYRAAAVNEYLLAHE